MYYQARPAWRTQWLEIVTAIILLVIAMVMAVWWWTDTAGQNALVVVGFAGALLLVMSLFIFYSHFSWRYTIDDDNIECVHGIVAREIQSIRTKDLRNINVKQSFSQRIFGLGDVEFSSAGGSGVEVVFRGISDPLEVKRIAQDVQERGEPQGRSEE